MITKKDAYRILDVNFNRSKEGLRVCEEIMRFVLKDKKLTIYLRHLRYQITEAVSELPVSYAHLLAFRNSKQDLGKKFYAQRKGHRLDALEIFLLNFQRVKESLRVLEEFSLFLNKKSAEHFQNIRFKTYHLEKTIFEKFQSIRYSR